MVQCVSCAAAVLVLWSGVVSVVSALTSHSHLGFHNASYKLEGGLSLKVYPSILSASRETVTVTWSSLSSPSASDWVGLYSPPRDDVYRINPAKQAPIKYQYANYSDTHLSEGSGSLDFRAINMRQAVVFGFFTGGFDSPTLVAISDVVYFKNPSEPLQGHLALTGDPSEMKLMWVTRSAHLPVVYWDLYSGSYSSVHTASSSTYNASTLCGSPATDFGWRTPGLLHTVTMNNLVQGSQYFYMFGDTFGWSTERNFTAAPKIGDSVTTTFITIGDMGCAEVDGSLQMYSELPSLGTTALIERQLEGIDFVLHLGGISYAQGYSSVWDTFFDQIEAIATKVPYMVSIGSHERNWPHTSPGYFNSTASGGECGVPHEMRFAMPTPALDQPWYGFVHGQVHIVVMSTEHDFRPGSLQYRFLSKYLETKVNRTETPWLIFSGHRPMYVSSSDASYPGGHLAVAQLLQESLEPLFMKHKVTLALWAHLHAYQRTCPMFRQNCTEGGTVHVVMGTAGRELSTNFILDEDPDYIEVSDFSHYGYTRITVDATSLTLEFVHSEDNIVYDTVELVTVSDTGAGSCAKMAGDTVASAEYGDEPLQPFK